jgi:hypothetical protein
MAADFSLVITWLVVRRCVVLSALLLAGCDVVFGLRTRAEVDAMADGAMLPSDLLVHLTFDDGLFVDASPRQREVMCDPCPTIGAGKVGAASAHFDGTSCLFIADAPDLRPLDFTLAVWVSSPNLTQTADIFSRAYQGAMDTTNTFATYQQGSSYNLQIGGMRVPLAITAPGAWFHLAGVYLSSVSTFTAYLNGVPQGSVTASLAYDMDALTVGCDVDVGIAKFFFTGDIDDVRLYDRALSGDQVYALSSSP